MKNKVQLLSVIAAIAVVLLGTSVDASDKTPKKIKMAVSTINKKSDVGWGQDMYNAYLYIKKNYADVVDVTFSDRVPWGDMPTFLKTQGSLGTELIFMDSAASWGEALKVVASKYPNTWYICTGEGKDAIAQLPQNTRVYMTGMNEGSFLAGVAAGMKTKTNKVAFLGSMDYPAIIALSAAFELGAKWINPGVKMFSQYVGSFDDPEKGYENANVLIANGVDVICMNASESGLGAVKACKEKGVWFVGAAVDQSHLAPEVCITSVLVNHPSAAALALAEYRAGILMHGKIQINTVSGLKDITPLTNVSEDIKAKVEQARFAIFREAIRVPSIYDGKKATHLSPADYGIPSPKELGIK
jgi:basic membrane protein A